MSAAPSHFGDRLAAAVQHASSQVVLGLDPDPSRLWPSALPAAEGRRSPAEAAAAAVAAHCCAVIDAVADAVVAVKPQLACFERLGAPGRDALQRTCDHGAAAGLLVLADGKRGDIDVSARAYGQAVLGATPTPWGEVEGLGADALTAAPYMGVDTLQALLDVARPSGRGLFVLVRTSNPGAADLEDLPLAGPDGETVADRVAAITAGLGVPGPESGLADVGAVVGATVPAHLARLRARMPAVPFLLPGIGAQGGRVEDLAPAFAPGRAGGLVTASRSIVRAHEADGAPSDPAAAARAEAERLREIAWSLG